MKKSMEFSKSFGALCKNMSRFSEKWKNFGEQGAFFCCPGGFRFCGLLRGSRGKELCA
jgi:hypothetical protein